MEPYLDLQRQILAHGLRRADRTGVGTLSVFGHTMRLDLGRGFPLLTTKKLHWRSIAYELLWFLTGSTNIRYLHEHGVTIWDDCADERGEVGPVYGAQWRAWGRGDAGPPIDQLTRVLDDIDRRPASRRMVVSAWNVGELERMSLPPCHPMFQLHVGARGLSCLVFQRSADVFLGLPFDLATYALLVEMIAHTKGLGVGELIYVIGDAHLYLTHLEQARRQVEREPRPLPRLRLEASVRSLFDFRFEHLTLEGYDPHPHIKVPRTRVV